MDRFAVCICTYNRPIGLRRLLSSLMRQRLHDLQEDQIALIVVDNSKDGCAAEICAAAKDQRFTLHYRHEPRRGLVFARNASLDAAREIGATYILSIDDDEVAGPTWLEALYARIKATGAAAAIGPVYPIFESKLPKWLPTRGYVVDTRVIGGFVDEGYTCNAIVSMGAIETHGLRFNPRFNETGGEDTMFFGELRRRGLQVAWAPDAPVHEFVPRERMRAGWLWRRWYRTGNVTPAFQPSHFAVLDRTASLCRGLARIGIGSVWVARAAIFKGWLTPDAVVASGYTLCRGAGFVAYALGSSYREYARRDYR